MGKFKYLAIFLILAFVVFGFGFLYFLLGCVYSGSEFSPDDFSVRSFSYRYEPISDSVVSGRVFSKENSFWMPDLVKDKFIQPIFKKEQTWHLIEDNGNYYRGASVDSDARFLVDFLQLQNEDYENTWTAWNSKNPKLAVVLWPLIAEMARDEMYLVVGDVLSFVLDADVSKPKEFGADLEKEVANAYLKMSEIDFENNKLTSAKNRISKSIKYASNSDARLLLKKIDRSIANGDSDVSDSPDAMPK